MIVNLTKYRRLFSAIRADYSGPRPSRSSAPGSIHTVSVNNSRRARAPLCCRPHDRADRLRVADDLRRLRGAPPPTSSPGASTRFGRKLAIASSFSIEDCVVIDLASKAARAAKADGVRVFALDTGRLPDETYMTAERVRMKYGVEIEWLFPQREPVEKLIRLKGLYSFRDSLENRHECCGIRKVEPLGRALAGLDAWVTGLRNEQSVTRTDTPAIEIDDAHGGIVKLNPIVRWSMDRGPRLRRRAPRPDPPAARSRLPVDRLRPLHARRSSPASTRAPAAGGGRIPRTRSAGSTSATCRIG